MSSSALKTSAEQLVQDLLRATEVIEAFRLFETEAAVITEDHIRICSIPASPFGERLRSEHLRERFLEIGLSDVTIDEAGNCLGMFQGSSLSPLMVVSAHLDTVFSEDTDFTVRRHEHRLLAPGISDDGCGLAALIAIARALVTTRTRTTGSVLFVGTVGEEGEGNLRGVRHLFTQVPWAGRIDSFLSFDGPGIDRITNRALGSRRYRVKLVGRGGHSWGDFGLPNPVHALGRAIAKLASYPLPKDPRTTFNVGKIQGGASVNAIPHHASMDVDLRSCDEGELRRLDAYFRRAVHEAVDHENDIRRPGDSPLSLVMDLVGERPTGDTSPNSLLVELAQEATRAMGVEAQLEQSSTDSNFPISLGIPSITVGAGGASGCSHTLDEWYEPLNRDQGLKRGLLIILGMVGLEQKVIADFQLPIAN
ncbi:MAG TPA: M20/M25/M40 family metallo-hydrolase [Pyrinomonadaceae bacterium]|jgi:acetylornithine deacetylase/succinyl-diaminopimelate desuccinylase-like protein|nr:M20/M25/M40 family metallo-hydrolase [Pyrinomonadaceae bacterium]